MQKLKINFRYCYGIKKLTHEFDFSRKTYSIYSPNGVMKTSFAKTFIDFSKGQPSKDLMFPKRTTIREIKNENDVEIAKEDVFVVKPYDEQFESSKVSTLLVNKELKKEYDKIHTKIEKEKEKIFKKLKQLSGLSGRSNNIEEELSKSFDSQIYNLFEEIEPRILKEEKPKYVNIIYNEIFNDAVLSFLNTKDFKDQIQEYIKKYNELLASSIYLKKDFNHYHALMVQKNLKNNGFFAAKHSVNLFDGKTKKEIEKEEDFGRIIQEEKNRVLNNEELQKKFDIIDNKLSTVGLRKFRDYLFDNKEILTELSDLNKFRKEIWISYFIEQKESYKDLLQEYKTGGKEIKRIVNEAKKEETEWEKVINIFNKRFSVPFELEVENQEDVILKSDIPTIKFTFKDLSEKVIVEKTELLRILSNGEKRALYILNVIFEVEARKKANQETLFIFDDIADSFDYKNKYAIIEYLKEVSEFGMFYQIILTHNFDFHRTISGRLDLGRSNKLNTIKTKSEIKLTEEKYQKCPFLHWKNHLDNDVMLIASIPFIRNLAEFCGDKTQFENLTSALHIKEDTHNLTINRLEIIFKDVLRDKRGLTLQNQGKKIIDLVFELADTLSKNNDDVIELENKITLSIAIRLKAEKYLINRINDDAFVNSITKHQTFKLIEKFKEKFPSEKEQIKLLEQINLMTPENIHINSFMYEPILDMSNHHLKRLYQEVQRVLLQN